jgi:hypothetical protein
MRLPSVPKPQSLERVLVCLALLLVPTTLVFQYRFLPFDDCLRHAAKAVSGKPWSDILVLRPDFTIDPHRGWHALLAALHRSLGLDAPSLVVFSYFGLFLLVAFAPLPAMRWPEAWALSILAASLAQPATLFSRLIRGRPYLFTEAALLFVLSLWRRSERPTLRKCAATALAIGLSVWLHGTAWYLWILPLAAFFLARPLREAGCLLGCWSVATVAAAALTGQPLAYLSQAVKIGFFAFSNGSIFRVLVGEFQPSDGSGLYVLVLAALALARKQLTGQFGERDERVLLALGVLGWLLGLRVFRFWGDWGQPAAMLWAAYQIEAILATLVVRESWTRAGIALVACTAFFLAGTGDIDGRWSGGATPQLASGAPCSPARDAEADGWLPAQGGILYSASMDLFVKLFYEHPDANWRYAFGFEPGMMTEENLRVLRDIQRWYGSFSCYAPWVAKMRLEDRLAIQATARPDIPELEWHEPSKGLWLGRRRREAPGLH